MSAHPTRSVVRLCVALLLLLAPALCSAHDDGDSVSHVPSIPARPILRIDDPHFDWGQIVQGDRPRHSFQIHNDGTAPLRIERVKTSCGCTTSPTTPRCRA